jgi:hypothetical protein
LTDHAAWLAEDAADRHAALAAATEVITSDGRQFAARMRRPEDEWLELAGRAYTWLRDRDSLHVTAVKIIPGKPQPEGTTMSTVFNLNDTDQVEFSLTGKDAKGADVPLPAGFTAAWTLADPDASGATLTPSADTTSAVVGSGVPDTNLLLSVVVTNPDGSTANGAEAIVVLATAETTVGLVAGTPTPEGA